MGALSELLGMGAGRLANPANPANPARPRTADSPDSPDSQRGEPETRARLLRVAESAWTAQTFLDISGAIIHGNEGDVYEQHAVHG